MPSVGFFEVSIESNAYFFRVLQPKAEKSIEAWGDAPGFINAAPLGLIINH